MPIAPSLQQFVDTELGRSAALIESAIRGVQTLLLAGPGASAAEHALHGDLADRLRRHAAVYRASFVDSLVSRAKAELARDGGGTRAPPRSGSAGLALMDESRVEIDIEISRATQVIDDAAEWELRELQTFTSTLIGQAHVSAESNPLRPMQYAGALWDAACAVDSRQAHRAALLRLSATVCAPLLRKQWAAASTRLESAGITPGIYRSRVIPSGRAQAAGEDVGAVRQLLASMPVGAPVQRGAERFVPPSSTEPTTATGRDTEAALARVDDIVRGLPPKTLSKLQAAALTARLGTHRSILTAAVESHLEERQGVELVARVFDAVLADSDLQPSFVPVVARLQIPALRLALREPSALAASGHPVWQLLDRIGQASASYPHATDRRGVALLALCTRLTDELVRQHEGGTALCRKALGRLDEFLAAQLEAQRKAAALQVQALRDAEQLETLAHPIAERLAEQMAPLRPHPVVRAFLGSAWARVLATALVRQTEDDEPARSYIRLVDDLLWSVQSPDHPASRQRLAALLPPMLQCLREGMASIALPEAEQHALLDQLQAIHASALQRGEPDGVSAAKAAAAPRPGPTAVEPSDERTTARETMIDLASLDTVPAALLPSHADEPAGDAPARRVAALRSADRARLFVDGRWARVQLLWRSDRGDFLLFASETVGETCSITRRALERLAAAGLLRPLEDQSLSQRAFDTVERRLAVSAG